MNYILRIKDDAIGWLESIEQIKDFTITFYSQFFSSEGYVLPPNSPFQVPRVSSEDNQMMQESPLEELKLVVFFMSANSTQDPMSLEQVFTSTVG